MHAAAWITTTHDSRVLHQYRCERELGKLGIADRRVCIHTKISTKRACLKSNTAHTPRLRLTCQLRSTRAAEMRVELSQPTHPRCSELSVSVNDRAEREETSDNLLDEYDGIWSGIERVRSLRARA
jgi:hypothetical protein